MPGNVTLERGAFLNIQSPWRVGNLLASQVDKKIAVCGTDGIFDQRVSNKCSLVGMSVQLSEFITAGGIEVVPVINGVKVPKSIIMTDSSGDFGHIKAQPGKVIVDYGDKLEVWYSSNAGLTPGTIEAFISIYIQLY
jgi:hypothetical protein